MRVLLLGVAIEGGGAERVMVDLARGLKARKHDVLVAFLEGTESVVPQLEEQGIPCRRLLQRQQYAAGPLADFTPGCVRRFRGLAREFRPDVVHSHIPRPTLWAALAARLGGLGAPLVYTEHSVQEVYPGWARWVYRAFLPVTDHVVAVSEASARSFRRRWGWPESRVTRIWNGIEVARVAPLRSREEVRAELRAADNDFVICNIGKLSRPKAQEVLVQALAELVPALPRLRCWIAGGAEFEPATAEFVRGITERSRLAERLQLLGVRSDVPDLLHAADAFVLSSRQEGFPITILEAMAAGRPVVATDVGGCSEAVAHGLTGLVVPPENPQALAAALAEMVTHPAEARAMGQAGRARVAQHFTVDAMAEQHLELYRRVARD